MNVKCISLKPDAISPRNLLDESPSPWFAKLVCAVTKYLDYFRPDHFSQSLPASVRSGPAEEIFPWWTGEEQLPIPAAAGVFHSCFLIWRYLIGLLRLSSASGRIFAAICLCNFAHFADETTRRMGALIFECLWKWTVSFLKHLEDEPGLRPWFCDH